MMAHGMIVATLAVLRAVAQDTAGKVAYVPQAGGPPDTSSYMWAGYAVAALVYGGYIVLLLRRMAHSRKGSGSAP
jgi:hypothetical protein